MRTCESASKGISRRHGFRNKHAQVGGQEHVHFLGGVSAPETIQAATAVLFLIQKGRGGGSLKASTPLLCPDRLIRLGLGAKTICSV